MKWQAESDLGWVLDYLRNNRNHIRSSRDVRELRIKAAKAHARERGVLPSTIHRNLKLALELDGCGDAEDLDELLRKII